MAALPEGAAFEPLMTLYLTEDTDPEDVAIAAATGLVTAVKLYPAGATTNSASGVRNFDRVRGVLETMARDQAAALRPWRGDRPHDRRLRPGVRCSSSGCSTPFAGRRRGFGW